MRGAGKYLDYLGAQAHVVPACELCVTTAGLHALAVLSVHPLSTYRAEAERGMVQVAHGGSTRICSKVIHLGNFARLKYLVKSCGNDSGGPLE